MGLQLSAKLGDKELGFRYLERALCQGISRKLIYSDSLVLKLKTLNQIKWNKIFNNYDSIRNVYENNINIPVRQIIDSLFDVDQVLTGKLNNSIILRPYYWIKWNRQNKKHVEVILELIMKYGYPGERLIGMSTSKNSENKININIRYGTNYFIGNNKVLYMFVHYFSKRRNDLNNVFFNCIKNRTMTAYEYAVLNDFMARWGKR
ncbi:MAG: hypothetical protein GY756_08785, partial [bacterium]|nr:hypothetical protein [bacterium]